ncbi:protein eyes shut homolog [Pogona vitticeps]
MTIYLTVKTSALNGTLLYTSDEHDGENFLHLYLVDGRPTAQFGCGTSTNVLTVTSSRSISRDTLLPITISYMLPFDNPEGYCLIEMMTDENVPLRRGTHLPHQLTQVTFGPIFLGNVPHHVKIHPSSGPVSSFQGCIREFQVNNKELFIIDEALGGRNIENCNVPICDNLPCRNGGTCTRYVLAVCSPCKNFLPSLIGFLHKVIECRVFICLSI